MPEYWTRCERTLATTAPQSTLTAAIQKRDIRCPITAFEDGTQVAHLVPEHEKQWFLANSMSKWNCDLTLDSDNLLRDLSNAVLLRSDMHTAFDQRKFVFFPKDPEGFVLHMLEPTRDIGPLYHNTHLNIPYCSLEFLFARFAWSIFPSLSGFLSRPGKSRLVVRSRANTGDRIIEEVDNATILGRKATASRNHSPTKRARAVAGLDDEDVKHNRKRRQTCEAEPSFNSTLPTLEDNGELEPTEPVAEAYPGSTYFDDLRRKALQQQRPAGHVPRPPYDRNRPAKEELELMGVEILENLGDDDDFCSNGSWQG